LFLTGGAAPARRATECDVKGAYGVVDIPIGSVALTSLGEMEELETVLAPSDLKSGAYDITVTRKAKDLYRVDGTSTYLVTRFCFEYGYSAKAVLRYRSYGSAGTGTLIFTK
jgi:hypothetical protein